MLRDLVGATMSHDLKCWPEPYQAIVDGLKTFEWRRDDRNFRVGDRLNLREWDPATKKYTGRRTTAEVIYLLRDAFEVPRGFVVMSIRPLVSYVPSERPPP